MILTSVSFAAYLQNIAGGITMGVLNAGILKSVPICLPPVAMQNAFAARVADIRAMQSQQIASRARLDDLFQSTLQRAFEGEL
jgi:type I restriction enzyme S subunit